MRLWEMFAEGGWDNTATQSTVITPNVVKAALIPIKKLIDGVNSYLKSKDIPDMRVGALTGSSAYYQVDPEENIYGDIDLQIVVPAIAEFEGKSPSEAQKFWLGIINDYINNNNLNYIHPQSKPGHPVVSVGNDKWIQVDLMPHPEPLEKWGRYRVTPERGIKGLLMGNMFSVLGELLTMSIQHAGVQFKVRDGVRQDFTKTRKDYELVTLSSDIENFILDIFKYEAKLQQIKSPRISKQLAANTGVKPEEVKIRDLVNALKGLAESFELNGMFGKGHLAQYNSADDFISKFKDRYKEKAIAAINASKRDKAATPEAIARAESDKKKISQGLEMVLSLF